MCVCVSLLSKCTYINKRKKSLYLIDKYNKSQHTKIKFYRTQNVQDSQKKVVHSNVPKIT